MSATIIQFPVRSRWSAKRVYRLTRTFVVLALLIWGVTNFFAGQSATATSTVGSSNFEYVTVYAGDTLWSIAEQQAPDQDPSDYVQKIIDLNNLQNVNVEVGQQLALPNN